MIKVKKSPQGFSTSERKINVDEALRELDCALMRGDSRSVVKTKCERNSLTVTRRQSDRPGPLLTWIFEGPEEEIIQLLDAAAVVDDEK